VQTLPNIIVTANYHLIKQIFANGDVLFEANCHECRPDLGHLWLVKAQIEAVVRQRTNLDMLSVIADANDGDLGGFDCVDQLQNAAAVFAACHAVDLVHDYQMLVGRCVLDIMAAFEVRVDRTARTAFT